MEDEIIFNPDPVWSDHSKNEYTVSKKEKAATNKRLANAAGDAFANFLNDVIPVSYSADPLTSLYLPVIGADGKMKPNIQNETVGLVIESASLPAIAGTMALGGATIGVPATAIATAIGAAGGYAGAAAGGRYAQSLGYNENAQNLYSTAGGFVGGTVGGMIGGNTARSFLKVGNLNEVYSGVPAKYKTHLRDIPEDKFIWTTDSYGYARKMAGTDGVVYPVVLDPNKVNLQKVSGTVDTGLHAILYDHGNFTVPKTRTIEVKSIGRDGKPTKVKVLKRMLVEEDIPVLDKDGNQIVDEYGELFGLRVIGTDEVLPYSEEFKYVNLNDAAIIATHPELMNSDGLTYKGLEGGFNGKIRVPYLSNTTVIKASAPHTVLEPGLTKWNLLPEYMTGLPVNYLVYLGIGNSAK